MRLEGAGCQNGGVRHVACDSGAGCQVVLVRRHVDVDKYHSHIVQQVAAGLRWVPVPDILDALAHVLLQHSRLPVRARIQGKILRPRSRSSFGCLSPSPRAPPPAPR